MIVVLDHDRSVAFSYEDMSKYAGPGSPGGVAHAYKVLERALPLLAADEPPQRREITIRTAFGGPGARDAFELATRAVTDGRYTVDPALARTERGVALERFVFELGYAGRSVTLAACPGTVTEEFIALTRAAERTPEQEERLVAMKLAMAERVMAAPADEVYEVLS